MRRGSDGGQATVELALVLPLLAMMVLALLQVALVARDAVALAHATRAAARVAIVDPTETAVTSAAVGAVHLDARRLAVDVTGPEGPDRIVKVTVRYRSPTAVPIVGRLLGDVALADELIAMAEGPARGS